MTQLQQLVINLVNEGLTVSQIAEKLCRNISSISSVVKRFNLKPKKAYENTVDSEFFDNIDTEEKAYLLGFFIADGCINKVDHGSKSRFSIGQSIDDLEVVEAFKRCLKVPTKISYSNNLTGAKHRKVQCRLRWTSQHMESTLKQKYNICQNKTLDTDFIFPIETIPADLRGHFVRGFIDGDGYMGDNGRENNFSVSVVGTSENFITMIGKLVSDYTKMSYKIYKTKGKTCEYISLRWSCDRVSKLEKITSLRHFLYDNASIFLSRKKEEIDRYIEYRAKALGNTNEQCNALKMNPEMEYNSSTSARPLTGNAEGENLC